MSQEMEKVRAGPSLVHQYVVVSPAQFDPKGAQVIFAGHAGVHALGPKVPQNGDHPCIYFHWPSGGIHANLGFWIAPFAPISQAKLRDLVTHGVAARFVNQVGFSSAEAAWARTLALCPDPWWALADVLLARRARHCFCVAVALLRWRESLFLIIPSIHSYCFRTHQECAWPLLSRR